MFQLSVVDHIRLSFATIAGAYESHAAAASRLARWSWYVRLALVTLLAAAVVVGLLALGRGRGFQIAATALTAAAFVGCTLYVALDLEPRIYGHRSSAARFWLLTERYRALLAEVRDQSLDSRTIAARRDGLMEEARACFEHAPPADHHTYDIARKALSGTGGNGYSEEEIDAMLPASLRRPKDAAA
jgi:hypothetical protein